MEQRVRGYRGREDLTALLAFASRLSKTRRPFAFGWHPGDFVWNLQGAYDEPQDNRMWFRDEAIEAFAGLDGAMLWVEALPPAEDRLIDLVLWAEAVHEGHRPPEAPALAIRACDADLGRIARLEALGYRRAGPEGVQFRLDLAKPLPWTTAAEGFRTRDCLGLDAGARAKVHRDAWDSLGHLGLPEARSSFSTDRYLSLRGAPGYDPRLDIVVEDAEGRLVANCICWADEASGVGVFEPVGVSPAVRGRRIARLAIHEGLRRLQARGLQEAHVGTAHFNTSAIAAYLACGFTPAGTASLWSKPPS
jgi:ribosomal protein S18 acetylase RimI-like enzyme